MKQKRGKKFLEILNSKLVIGALIFIMLSLVSVFASDMIFEGGDLTVDTNVLFVDADNNRVGIRTTSPGRILEIAKNDTVTVYSTNTSYAGQADDLLKIFNANNSVNDAYAGIHFQIGGVAGGQWGTGRIVVIDPNSASGYGADMAFGVRDQGSFNIIERMRIISTGNVGIGTTSPDEKLEVVGNIRISEGGYLDTGTQIGYDIYIGDTSDTSQYGNLWIKGALNGNDGLRVYPRDEAGSPTHYAIFTYDDNNEHTQIGTAEDDDSLVIETSGYVGIGTNSPVMKLDVDGNVTADDFITKSLFYNGDALSVIKNIKSKNKEKGWGEIDHSTLGGAEVIFDYEYIDENNKKVVKTFEGQSMDKTIALLLKANQQLMEELCKKDNSYNWC